LTARRVFDHTVATGSSEGEIRLDHEQNFSGEPDLAVVLQKSSLALKQVDLPKL
jgi:hypothetical protein